ncbi:MAG: adenosine deaminase [Ghiorsea sp.]|nr:adenosine deaminase [Ghiorsea sp.]
MKKIILLASMVAVASFTTGCATILSGKTQKVNIATTNNVSTTATVDGKQVTLPAMVEVNRKNQDLVINTTNKECMGTTVAGKTVNPVFFVNILSGGPFGSSTDYATGSMWEYDETIMVNCK